MNVERKTYTPETRQMFIEAIGKRIEQGQGPKDAAKAEGLPYSTYYHWVTNRLPNGLVELTGKIVKYDKETRKAVRRAIREAFKAGFNYEETAAHLSAEGFKRPDGSKITPHFVCDQSNRGGLSRYYKFRRGKGKRRKTKAIKTIRLHNPPDDPAKAGREWLTVNCAPKPTTGRVGLIKNVLSDGDLSESEKLKVIAILAGN